MIIDKGNSPPGGGDGALPADDGVYSDQHLRVSDAEREAVTDRLAEHFAAGRLGQAEFDDRVGRAMSAKTRADLSGLFADLSETGAPAVPELPSGGGGTPGSPIEFRLDGASGVPTYLQLVQQVEHALRLGYLKPGDQLPKVRDVVASLAINPNTVLKAYKELETKGLAAGRPGQGTFVQATLRQVALPELAGLHKSLLGWLTTADVAGLDEDGIVALFTSALRDFYKRRGGTGNRRSVASGETEGVA
jgi:DNA-binding transcriptional regulator YhcF (GntR family)